jgi:1-pyrroline-5-carboxylate dehydrogenase
MINASLSIPKPSNEPVKEYAPGSVERDELKKQCKQMLGEKIEIPPTNLR